MKLFSRGKTLYHPGPLAKAKLPRVVAATRHVLKDFGIDFITLDLLGSGFEAWYAGEEEIFQQIMRENLALLKKERVTLIITNDPHEAWTFKERYGLNAIHTTQLLKEHLEKIKKQTALRASYHHPCFLTKLGVRESSVLAILRRAGVHVPSTNKGTGCCGSVGHDFSRANPELAARIAARRSKELPEKLLITCCPHAHVTFKQERRRVKDVVELLTEMV